MRPRQENITERIDRIKYEYEDSDKRPAHLDNKNIYSFEDQFNKNFKSIKELANDKKPTKIVTEPTEENLYEIWLQMKKAGELKEDMSFKEFEKNYRLLDIDLAKKRKKSRDTWQEFVASGGKKLPKLSKEEIEKVRGNQRVRNYILRKYKPKVKTGNPVKIDFDLTPTFKPDRTAFIGLWPTIKDSSIYKLLENPRAAGTELGYEGIMEIYNLMQKSGLLKNGGRV